MAEGSITDKRIWYYIFIIMYYASLLSNDGAFSEIFTDDVRVAYQ